MGRHADWQIEDGMEVDALGCVTPLAACHPALCDKYESCPYGRKADADPIAKMIKEAQWQKEEYSD